MAALAISGGVDSMALAFLCTRLRKHYPNLRISDNRLSNFQALIVSHGLRQGSLEEAHKVARVLSEKMGMKSHVLGLRWAEVVGDDVDPTELPNVETVARTLRYRRIGVTCGNMNVGSLFTAHHEGDQYETILMRLITGRGYQGVGGMRPAGDIPECYDLHNVSKSGFVDDQMRVSPFYNHRPTKRSMSSMKDRFLEEMDLYWLARQMGMRPDRDLDLLGNYEGISSGGKKVPSLTPIEIEDGGVMVYKPLLGFSKDRLIATCEENGIPWFEDHTNHDPSLTLRNAVRHMCKTCELPVALQKPAILSFAARCRARVDAEEAEAKRLFYHICIKNFEPNAGTAMVQMRRFVISSGPRKGSAARRQRRLEHCRLIAAILVRRLIGLLTPEQQLTPPGQLDKVVTTLFPSLRRPEDPPVEMPPKAFTIGGVFFVPMPRGESLRWLLSREPHHKTTDRIPPKTIFHWMHVESRWRKHPSKWPKPTWSDWKLYDNRYWIRIGNRLPFKIYAAPYEMEHASTFRESLGNDVTRDKLASLLKHHAPARVRYTLPALYSSTDITYLMNGGDHWPDESELPELTQGEKEGDNRRNPMKLRAWKWECSLAAQGKPQLLALPTLGIGLPGLDKWLVYEVRYRKVDNDLLQQSVSDGFAEHHCGFGRGGFGKRMGRRRLGGRRSRVRIAR